MRVADGLKPPKREQLGNVDQDSWEFDSKGKPRDPWQETNYIPLLDEEGQLLTFSVSSVSGIKEIGSLCRAYAAHRTVDQHSYPIVALDVGSYLHSDRSRGRIKYPELNIVGWAPKEKFAQAMAAASLAVPAAPSCR